MLRSPDWTLSLQVTEGKVGSCVPKANCQLQAVLAQEHTVVELLKQCSFHKMEHLFLLNWTTALSTQSVRNHTLMKKTSATLWQHFTLLTFHAQWLGRLILHLHPIKLLLCVLDSPFPIQLSA